ncbi:hypothetical protein D3C83_160860 [compost metagenome]
MASPSRRTRSVTFSSGTRILDSVMEFSITSVPFIASNVSPIRRPARSDGDAGSTDAIFGYWMKRITSGRSGGGG